MKQVWPLLKTEPESNLLHKIFQNEWIAKLVLLLLSFNEIGQLDSAVCDKFIRPQWLLYLKENKLLMICRTDWYKKEMVWIVYRSNGAAFPNWDMAAFPWNLTEQDLVKFLQKVSLTDICIDPDRKIDDEMPTYTTSFLNTLSFRLPEITCLTMPLDDEDELAMMNDFNIETFATNCQHLKSFRILNLVYYRTRLTFMKYFGTYCHSLIHLSFSFPRRELNYDSSEARRELNYDSTEDAWKCLVKGCLLLQRLELPGLMPFPSVEAIEYMVASCRHLSYIEVSGSTIEDVHLLVLTQLTSLQYLGLKQCMRISVAGIVQFLTTLKDSNQTLKVDVRWDKIALADFEFTDEDLETIGRHSPNVSLEHGMC